MPDKFAHCGFCGTAFQMTGWPRMCTKCLNPMWRNPLPVAVGLIPIVKSYAGVQRMGLLVGERGIAPNIGEFALTGGYVNFETKGETVQEALAREIKEENNLDIPQDTINVLDVLSGTNGGTLLVFCITRSFTEQEVLEAFKPNNEVRSIKVLWEPEKLAFSTHTEMVQRFFAGSM
jgi:8-oxo-dGTP diphosphatase